jgi:hypothetical protein
MAIKTGIPEIDGPAWVDDALETLSLTKKREASPFQRATLDEIRKQIAAADDEIAVESKRGLGFAADESRAARDGRNARAKVDLAKMRREKLVKAARAIAEIE